MSFLPVDDRLLLFAVAVFCRHGMHPMVTDEGGQHRYAKDRGDQCPPTFEQGKTEAAEKEQTWQSRKEASRRQEMVSLGNGLWVDHLHSGVAGCWRGAFLV